MSVPVTIEGQKYFATLPSLADFRTFTAYLAKRRRANGYAAIPPGLSDSDLKRWMRLIDEECDAINPLTQCGELLNEPEGMALFFHALLRHESPSISMGFITGLVDRMLEGRPAAIESVRELRMAFAELSGAGKKNGTIPPGDATQETPSISTPSTSPSAQDTALAPM